jgi:hypothetical protein
MPNPLPDPPEELARLREDLVAFYHPANPQERLAVERIALAQQSILRAARLENSLFANPPGQHLHSILETEGFKNLLRYQAQAERAYRRAVEELMFLKSQRLPTIPASRPAAQPVASQPAAAVRSQPAAPTPPRTPAAVAAAASRASIENLALRL